VKRIVMLATAHEYQRDGHGLNNELAERLEYLLHKFSLQIILEEWSDQQTPSFANRFAQRRAAYSNVGTPDERQYQTYRFGVISHPAHDGTLPTDPCAPLMQEYGPYPQQENREEQMAENVCSAMREFESGLFLMGLAHLHSLFGKLRARNFAVTAYIWFKLLQ